MMSTKDITKNRCYHGSVKASRILPCYLLQDSRGVYLPFCNYLNPKQHQGLIVDKQRRKCENKKCWHYERYRTLFTPREVLRCVRKTMFRKKITEDKTIHLEPYEDQISQFIPYCANSDGMGVVLNRNHERCERNNCSLYFKLRPPRSKWKKCREPIVLHSLAELDISMFID